MTSVKQMEASPVGSSHAAVSGGILDIDETRCGSDHRFHEDVWTGFPLTVARLKGIELGA